MSTFRVWYTAGCQHHIHQETAHSAISVHIWMDISEKEVSEKADYVINLFYICEDKIL